MLFHRTCFSPFNVCHVLIPHLLPLYINSNSLDDDCCISPDAMCTFLERIRNAFSLQRNDTEIVILKKELHELLCHNTDLKGDLNFALDHLLHWTFVKLV